MKRVAVLLIFFAVCTAPMHAQYRGQEPRLPSVSEKIQSPSSGFLFGLVNPDSFHMSHSVSMGYASFGGQGLGLSMYTNSMSYQVSEPLRISADVSMMLTPFGSLASTMRNDISRIFVQRAQIEYRPSKDFGISLQYREMPFPSVSPLYNGFGSRSGMMFGIWDDDMR